MKAAATPSTTHQLYFQGNGFFCAAERSLPTGHTWTYCGWSKCCTTFAHPIPIPQNDKILGPSMIQHMILFVGACCESRGHKHGPWPFGTEFVPVSLACMLFPKMTCRVELQEDLNIPRASGRSRDSTSSEFPTPKP